MELAIQLKVLAHCQYVARHYSAFKGSIESIVSFIAYSIGAESPDPDQLSVFLRRPETQRTLETNYETALFRDISKQWHLISLAPPTDPAVCRRRLNHRPTSPGTQCRWCYQDSKGYAALELKPELDVYRNPVPASFLHPQCFRPWLAMRAIVERENTS
jgi:hypothetical protein